ncbi:hypothetical protein [Aquimarina sp. 2201CG5-10]|uniref:hypothetical protein n=1 Tax=Aquimarina callyspongiae TaxID=3098150 RepID=UPI002AB4EB10|nr:hypothetical protein [Aquimarina sp. 2201CG5-10]MDY8136391.1 hypothetical protein [Aquimarina sp. 2201CG5-10]
MDTIISKKRSVVIIIMVLIGSTSFAKQSIQNDELEYERFKYLIKVKQEVSKKFWPDFSKKILFGPMMYYSMNGVYVINPNEKLNKKISYKKLAQNRNLPLIGKVSDKIDSTALYMYVSRREKDSTKLDYKNTIAFFSDVSLTNKFIPDVKETNEWLSMVIHETFHQYQRKIKKFRKNQITSKKDFDRDTLAYFYKNIKWFRNSIKQENELLLNSLKENEIESIEKMINTYLSLKKNRISRVKEEFKTNITDIESSLERSEGTARYIEYKTKEYLKDVEHIPALTQLDQFYHPENLPEYTLEKDEWMYTIKGLYVYTIGFNLTRLLEKLKIEYQKTIFNHNRSFDDYLINFMKK